MLQVLPSTSLLHPWYSAFSFLSTVMYPTVEKYSGLADISLPWVSSLTSARVRMLDPKSPPPRLAPAWVRLLVSALEPSVSYHPLRVWACGRSGLTLS